MKGAVEDEFDFAETGVGHIEDGGELPFLRRPVPQAWNQDSLIGQASLGNSGASVGWNVAPQFVTTNQTSQATYASAARAGLRLPRRANSFWSTP